MWLVRRSRKGYHLVLCLWILEKIQTSMFQAMETSLDLSFAYHRQPKTCEKMMSAYTREVAWNGLEEEKPRGRKQSCEVLNGSPCPEKAELLSTFVQSQAFLWIWIYCFCVYWRIRLRSNSIHEHSFGNWSWNCPDVDCVSFLEQIQKQRLEFGTLLRGLETWIVCGRLLSLPITMFRA